MTEKQALKKMNVMVEIHYSSIPKAAKKWLKLFKVERVNLVFLNKIIENAKLKDEFENAQLRLFKEKFNGTLDLLKDVCKSESKKIGDGAISMHEIEQMIKALKDGFKSGQK